MTLVIFPSKTFDTNIPCIFDFNDRLEFGEAITGTTVTAVVFAGTDPTPSGILNGIPSHDSVSVTQNIWRGVIGTIYNVVAIATTSLGHVLTKEGKIAVITPGGLFGI